MDRFETLLFIGVILDGILVAEYLEKARILSKEMDLKWDLEQLDKVKRETHQYPVWTGINRLIRELKKSCPESWRKLA